jgi:hypothetical protein
MSDHFSWHQRHHSFFSLFRRLRSKIYVMASKQICVVVCQVVLDGSLNHIIYECDKKQKNERCRKEISIVNYITLCLIFYLVHNMLFFFIEILWLLLLHRCFWEKKKCLVFFLYPYQMSWMVWFAHTHIHI